MKAKMKHLTALLAAILALVLGVVLFAACDSGVEGTYKFYSMTEGDQTIKVGDEVEGVTLSEDYMTIEIKSDGTFTISIKNLASGESRGQSGTWETNAEDAGKIDLTVDGETITVSVSGGTLTMDMDGATATLKK